MGRLIQLSGVIVDAVYRVARVPLPGEEARVHGFALTPGGGMNAMIAARRAGMAVAWAGTLGTGPFAALVATMLKAEGIATMRPPRPGMDQGLCTVLVDDAGERSFIAHQGADGVIGPDDLARVRPRADDWLLLSGYGLYYPGSGPALADWLGRVPGGRLVFDPAPIVADLPPRLLSAAMDRAAWISANRAEARVLTGLDQPEAAALALARGRAGAVVRDGERGAWLAQGAAAQHVPPLAVRPVDTNGAGDTHLGYFIAALDEGRPPPQAVRRANVAAALSTLTDGPHGAPTRAQTEATLQDNPWP